MKRVSASLAPLLLLLAGCSTQAPPRFHSLMPPTAGVRPAAAAAALPAWQLLPVSVPPQVDQPQFVVRLADDTLALLEQERWIAPLADEARAALSEHMAVTLGTPGATPAAGRKDWRIAVDVQRFDSTPGRSTIIAVWSVQAGSAAPVLRCRGMYEQGVGAGVPALAAGHRQALQRLGAALASALTALDAGRSVDCPATTTPP